MPLDDPGEGMHAEIARELLASGDPFRLTLNGVVYVDKPPLLYWLQALAFTAGGRSELSARAVSAAAAVVAVAATAWLGARLLGAWGGALAGLALLSSTLFFAFARYVRPETLFVAGLALGFALMLAGLEQSRRRLVVGGLVVFGIAGLGKDPVGTLGPLLVVWLALALARRARPHSRWLPWPGAMACLALGLGWWIVAEARTPGTLWYAVVDNKVLNVIGARVFPDEDVTLSAIEFLAVAALGAAPWTLAAAVTMVKLVRARAWRDDAELPWVALALWTIAVVGLTLLSRFRLPHYGIPAYFAVALLAARAWCSPGTRAMTGLHLALVAALALTCGLFAASDGRRFLTAIVGATDEATRKSRLSGEGDPFPGWDVIQPLFAHATVVFGVASVLLTVALVRHRDAWTRPAAPAVIAIAMLLVMPDVASGLAAMSAHRSARAVAQAIAGQMPPGDVLAHEGPIEQSGGLEWYSGRRPVIVDGRRSVLAFGATRPERARTFWNADDLERAWTAGHVWVISTRAPAHSIAARLPGARLVGVFGGRWLYAPAAAR